MERIKQILAHKSYQKYIRKNEKCEKNRKFCRHNLPHAADVARIAYIYALEQGLPYTKEVIYAAALLHDIGKWQQYKKGIPHNEASADLALEILINCSFTEEECALILDSIKTHRRYSGNKDSLNYVIFMGDKLSRMCFSCKAEKECNWPKEQKNSTLYY